ncbi:hypothetical protein COCON_G00088090, partial [Conger conger]
MVRLCKGDPAVVEVPRPLRPPPPPTTASTSSHRRRRRGGTGPSHSLFELNQRTLS